MKCVLLNLNILSVLSKHDPSNDLQEVKNPLTSLSCWTALGLSPANLQVKNTSGWDSWWNHSCVTGAVGLLCLFFSVTNGYCFNDIHLPSTSRSWTSLSLRSRSLKPSIAVGITFHCLFDCRRKGGYRNIQNVFQYLCWIKLKKYWVLLNWIFLLDIVVLNRLDITIPK